MSTFPISSSIIQYVYEDQDGLWVIQVVNTDNNQIVATYGNTVLAISTNSDDEYVVEDTGEGSYPSTSQKVVLDSEEEGVLAIGLNVQNRAGLGTVDFRDCGRLYTWTLDHAPALNIANYPDGDLNHPMLWVGVDNAYVDAAYTESSTCG